MTSARCSYAACDRLADTDVDGWSFCARHLHEHRQLVAEDTARARAEQALASAVDGYLLPSCSLEPLLRVLHPPAAEDAVA